MARFYGTVAGCAKTTATRRGHKELKVQAASWSGAIEVSVYLNAEGEECYLVSRIPWKGVGLEKARIIAEGKS